MIKITELILSMHKNLQTGQNIYFSEAPILRDCVKRSGLVKTYLIGEDYVLLAK